MASFLVRAGINSISVNADAAYAVSKVVSEMEEKEEGKTEESESEVEAERKEGICRPKLAIDDDSAAGDKTEEKKERKTITTPILDEGVSQEALDEEAIVLEALSADEDEKPGGEEYEPGFGKNKKADVPSLNEAIPVESVQLENYDNLEEKEGEEISYDSKKNFENQAEETFDEKVKEVVAGVEARNAMEAEVKKREEEHAKDKKREVLDIF